MSEFAKRSLHVAAVVALAAAAFAVSIVWVTQSDDAEDARAAAALRYAVGAERKVEARSGQLTESVADLRAVSPRLDEALKTDAFTLELERGPATGAVVVTVNVDLQELQKTVRPRVRTTR